MHIKRVYKTSKGIFWDMATASLKKNRKAIGGNRPGDNTEYEAVQPTFILCAPYQTLSPYGGSVEIQHIFELTEVEVK